MRTPRTPRCRATGCSCARATSGGPRPASTPGCRWACGCCARSRRSSARRWTRSARQELRSRRCCPREPYEATGRWTEYGDGIFRLKDRKGGDYLLGPTHEEMFTLVVKDLYSSYKDLPLSLYQIQTKYRDEARPARRAAARPRVRDEGLLLLRRRRRRPGRVSYQKHREAYIRIFDRLGFDYVIVKATSGAMGGSKSEEFLAEGRVGEDTYVRCTKCDYAANVEAVQVRAPAPVPYDDAPAAHAEETPDTPDDRDARRPPQREVPARRPPLGGRRHAEERAGRAQAPRRHPRAARDRRTRRPRGRPEAARGTAGADRGRALRRGGVHEVPRAGQGLHRARRAGGEATPPASATSSTPASSRAPAGSPAPTSTAATSSTSWPAATSPPTAPSRPPRCATATPAPTATTARWSPRAASRWATSSSSAASTPTRWACRCSTRTASWSPSRWAPTASASRAPSPAIAEGTHDELGLCWPRNVAPADVHLVAAGKDEAIFAAAERIAHELDRAGVEVHLRRPAGKVSPGVKFKDAELIGVPTIVVVGRGLADGSDRGEGPADRRARGRARRPRRRPPGAAGQDLSSPSTRATNATRTSAVAASRSSARDA